MTVSSYRIPHVVENISILAPHLTILDVVVGTEMNWSGDMLPKYLSTMLVEAESGIHKPSGRCAAPGGDLRIS